MAIESKLLHELPLARVRRREDKKAQTIF